MQDRDQRKEHIAERRRRQILDAALAVFSQKSYGEATIPDIAREAGVAVGTIYNYFESKRALLVALIARHVLADPFIEMLERSPGPGDDAFLSSVFEDRLTTGFENMDRLILLFGEVQRDPDLRRQYTEQVLKPLLKRLEEYLRSRTASGFFRALDAGVIVRAVVGMVLGMSFLYTMEGDESPCLSVSRQDLASQLADFVLRGLESRPTGPQQQPQNGGET